MKLSLHQFDLPLKHVFTISRESIETQSTLIVELRQGDQAGYGEATPNRYYGVTIPRMVEDIRGVADLLSSSTADDPETLWTQLHERLTEDSFALCAIDQAVHDLHGKLRNERLFEAWDGTCEKLPASNFTIGIDSVDVMVQKLKEVPDWPIYKIKLGTDRDLEIVEQLRRHTSAVFRVDANCGWTVEQTLRNTRELQRLGVEFIEQPLPADDQDGHRRLYLESCLPIIADESCLTPQDVAACHERFHGINIKLVKCGGLTPARQMIRQARKLGLQVMVGCMTESTVGISAIAQLLPELDFVDMDGAELLAEDVASGVRVERGQCIYADQPGSGVQLLRRNEIQ